MKDQNQNTEVVERWLNTGKCLLKDKPVIDIFLGGYGKLIDQLDIFNDIEEADDLACSTT